MLGLPRVRASSRDQDRAARRRSADARERQVLGHLLAVQGRSLRRDVRILSGLTERLFRLSDLPYITAGLNALKSRPPGIQKPAAR
ncbi:hypothetical protein BCEN4_800069 [Burkholderia cenocepacia]|nr:hypothetical protein BCEN4_800069 [Burkholderia cenocepacia]